MLKISGILSSSPRVSAVDLSSAAPVRPGAPGFGAPKGISSLGDAARFTRSSINVGPDIGPGHVAWDSNNRVNIADQITEDFFRDNEIAAGVIDGGPSIHEDVLDLLAPVTTPVVDFEPTDPAVPAEEAVGDEPIDSPGVVDPAPVEPSPAASASNAYQTVAAGAQDPSLNVVA